MEFYKMGEVESHFAELIWENEPLGSGELVKLAQEKLDWKKSTTYTVLRKLCSKGLFENEDSVVRAVMTRDAYYANQCEQFVTENFGGSLPKFLAAFASAKKMSEKEIVQLQQFIEAQEEKCVGVEGGKKDDRRC